VLTNPKYVGDNVWNRISYKLKKLRVRNDPEMWVRSNGAFEPIVERHLFDAAQVIIQNRSRRMSEEDMLHRLRTLYQARGRLSGLIIDEAEDLPSSSTYSARFGSLGRAYQLVGFTPERDFKYIEINRLLRSLQPEIIAETIEQITQIGGHVEQDQQTHVLTVNSEFTVALCIARCQENDFLPFQSTLNTPLSLYVGRPARLGPARPAGGPAGWCAGLALFTWWLCTAPPPASRSWAGKAHSWITARGVGCPPARAAAERRVRGFLREWRTALRITAISFRARTQYRGDFITALAMGLAWQTSILVFATVILTRFPGLGGWTSGGVLLIVAIRLPVARRLCRGLQQPDHGPVHRPAGRA